MRRDRRGNISFVKEEEERILKEVMLAISSIKYGYVQIIIQDSRVVQIDKLEKIRVTPNKADD